jgi:bifunctional non-homologous end joining protein LigD
MAETMIRAGRRTVRISNPDKVLFPADGITKLDLAQYYEAVSQAMVEHTRDRPLNLWRWNNGIDKDVVVQQAIPKGAPEWVRRVTVPRRRGGDVEHAVGGEAATLVWLANQNCITPHV